MKYSVMSVSLAKLVERVTSIIVQTDYVHKA